MAGDGLVEEGKEPEGSVNFEAGRRGGQRRMMIQRGRAVVVGRYTPDADMPPGADVAEEASSSEAEPRQRSEGAPRLRGHARPREVEVRDLNAERAGRVFPCLPTDTHYGGCIGYDACKVLCWSPRPREREALVRVEKPTGGMCRDCVYAREVRGEVAVLNGRQVRLMECRLGYWHGRTTVHDFALNRIALNVRLPCPGFTETEAPHPVVTRLREAARRRRMGLVEKEEPGD